jgi:general secretion pathway protein I
LSRSSRNSRAGFTLIEVVVALAVIAASLTAIGALVAVSMRGTAGIEQRLAFRETLRAMLNSLPDRRVLNAGTQSGETEGYRWRVDVTPFEANFVDPKAPAPWQPQAVVIRAQSPSGQLIQINTIRLRKRAR